MNNRACDKAHKIINSKVKTILVSVYLFSFYKKMNGNF